FWWILESDELSAADKQWILGRSARTILRWPAPAYHFDCAQAHPSIRVSGTDEDDFVANLRAHLERWHPQPGFDPPRRLLPPPAVPGPPAGAAARARQADPPRGGERMANGQWRPPAPPDREQFEGE